MEKFMEDEKKAKERKKKEAFEKNPALQAFLESHPNIDFQYWDPGIGLEHLDH